jgi:hypothetical protein
MTRTLVVLIAVAIIGLSGCASSAPPPPPLAPRTGPVGDVRRLAVLPSGESKFTVAGDRIDIGPVVGNIVKWYPKAALWAPLAMAIQAGINWLTEEGRTSATSPHVKDISPGAIVADAFARTLVASGRFDQVRTLEREPVGDDRRQTDALVRVTVPAWGLLRVHEGKPDLMAGYVDVRAQMVVRPTGVVVWEHAEDVTHAERLPLQTFNSDRELARQELMDVLERAGQRLANELIYARSAGR